MLQDYGGTELASRASLSVAANANRAIGLGCIKVGGCGTHTNSWTSSFLFTLPIAFLGISAAQWHPTMLCDQIRERTNEMAAGRIRQSAV